MRCYYGVSGAVAERASDDAALLCHRGWSGDLDRMLRGHGRLSFEKVEDSAAAVLQRLHHRLDERPERCC